MMGSMMYLIAFVSTLVFGPISTEWGRRLASHLSLFIGFVGVLGISFC